jgi:hypothetical protein
MTRKGCFDDVWGKLGFVVGGGKEKGLEGLKGQKGMTCRQRDVFFCGRFFWGTVYAGETHIIVVDGV